MKLFYLANIRIPTEKAHGIAIAKACESFAKAGVETTLVVAHRRTPITESVFKAYGVQENFSVRFLPTLDLIRERAGRFVFSLQTFTFQISVFFSLLFTSRSIVLYTRDPGFMVLTYLGFRVVLECHAIPRSTSTFFYLARRAHAIVVISTALKESFVKAGFMPDDILVAPSGVDLSVFDIDVAKDRARTMLDLPAEAFIAMYTGNFTTMGQDKGIGDVIEALEKVPDAVFVAVGGSEKDRSRYVQEASAKGVLGRVILRGSTTQKILALYQKAADVLVMPFPDTPHYRRHMSPVKMFEYMAAKRPILATDLPTIREILDTDSALIVRPGDSTGIAEALLQVKNDPEKFQKRSETAYQKVAQYSWTARTARVLQHIV